MCTTPVGGEHAEFFLYGQWLAENLESGAGAAAIAQSLRLLIL
jgi:hypothetical protein